MNREPDFAIMCNCMRRRAILAISVLAGLTAANLAAAGDSQTGKSGSKDLKPFFAARCFECHDAATKSGGLAIEELLKAPIGKNAEAWEKVVGKLATRQM